MLFAARLAANFVRSEFLVEKVRVRCFFSAKPKSSRIFCMPAVVVTRIRLGGLNRSDCAVVAR